ncbi:MAG TPA: hydrogenase maturation protease [Acidimicrobiales bacterium]|nr:hydrogenase maturation protease [Acidimicrobiales bacterium]
MIRRVVVVAMGNEYRRDDGAGLAVVRSVRPRLGELSTPEVDAVGIGPFGDPLDLLGQWDDAALAVVVDAVRTGAPPGTVVVVELGARPGATDAAEAGRSGDAGEAGKTRGAAEAGRTGGAADGRGDAVTEPGYATGVTDRRASSTHGLGIAGALRLARAVGRAPDRVLAVGIEGEDFGNGTGLSDAVARAVEEAAARVLEIVGTALPCA